MSIPARLVVSQVISAKPEAVYAVLSDYVDGHPHILPKPEFVSLTVEQGGQGAGTVVRVVMQMMGMTYNYHMQVSEPTPGRVLKEEDTTAGVVTLFSVAPHASGCTLEIATEWRTKPGFAGAMERWLTPLVARPLYLRELDLVAAFMQKRA